MDTSDSQIAFDEHGVCDHCRGFEVNVRPHWHPDERGRAEVAKTVEQIKRSALQDLRVFSGVSVAFFTVVIWIVYRSRHILLGIMLTCLTAAMLTLIVQHFLRLEPGVLIANVGTLVFVMALSHTVYMTAHWKAAVLRGHAGEDFALEACRATDEAAFWSMVTAMLGFGSFLLAPAKPLRQFLAGTG